MSENRLLVISPVRNEAAHIERVARSVQAQSRRPDLWLVADDNSDDETPTILRRLEQEIPFMKLVAVPKPEDTGPDRLALALEARAFNHALGHAERDSYTHVAKLDGDMELPPDYFERLLGRFASEPGLGITGGSIVEPVGPGGAWTPITAPRSHVHGALKLYSRGCFDAVGGIQERLGWDTIDETYARMNGFETFRDPDLVARHHRPGGSADGKLRGRARHGECAYVARYSLPWVLLRSLKIAVRQDPRILSGLAFVAGYLRAAARRMPRVEDRDFKRFVRREHRARMLRGLTPYKPERSRMNGNGNGSGRPTVALAASIGGHIDLLVAVRRAFEAYDRVWLVESSSRATALLEAGEHVQLLPPFSRRLFRGNLRENIRAAVAVIRRTRPDVVVTSGSGIAVPFCVLARLSGSKLIFIETMARIENPSQSGRVLSRISTGTLVQWQDLAKAYPRVTVCKPALLEHVNSGLEPKGNGTFVGLGTHVQQFDRLVRMVDDAVGAGRLPGPVTVQRGVTDYEPRNFPQGDRWMLPDLMEQAVRDSEYVICHAGSGIISLALRAGRRPLILARRYAAGEHIDDHQTQLVRRLAELGLAVELGDEITEADLAAAKAPLPQGLSNGAGDPSVERALRAKLRQILPAEDRIPAGRS